jgi:PilZ domain-containing protein
MDLSAETFYAIIESLRSDNHAGKGGEKRERPRVGLSARITLRVMAVGRPEQSISVYLRDISKAGIGIVHKEALSVGTQLALALSTKGSTRSQEVMYTVARCYGVGDGLFAIGARISTVKDLLPASGGDCSMNDLIALSERLKDL